MKQIADKDLVQITRFLRCYIDLLGTNWKQAEQKRKVSLLLKKLKNQ